uniref:Chromosome 15 open reading frame 65 n=2 Tax=Varanus komodoensis TaxID=61221 RepID=A0A8D2LSE6_VARKO
MTSEEKMLPRPTAKNAASFQWLPCADPGNPVFSCMLDSKILTTSNFLTKPQPLLYKTTSNEYGAIPPTSQMVPCKFFPKDNSFTNHLFKCGLTQFNCINTGVDKSKVYDYPDLANTI